MKKKRRARLEQTRRATTRGLATCPIVAASGFLEIRRGHAVFGWVIVGVAVAGFVTLLVQRRVIDRQLRKWR